MLVLLIPYSVEKTIAIAQERSALSEIKNLGEGWDKDLKFHYLRASRLLAKQTRLCNPASHISEKDQLSHSFIIF